MVSDWFLLLSCFVEISELNANSIDPSDLGLHCLPVSLLWDTRLKWVKISILKYGNTLIFFAEKMLQKLFTFLQQKISMYLKIA